LRTLSSLLTVLLTPSALAPPVPEDHRDVYIYHGRRSSNLVALTYDDGPHHEHTPALMGLLSELECPATFFVVGRACRGNPRTTEALAESSFEIGNHTETHANLRQAGVAEMRGEVDGLQEHLAALGVWPRVFRPPGGFSNRDVVEHMYGDWDMDIVMWSLDTRDWSSETTVAGMTEQILGEARGGEIILMHDIRGKAIDVTRSVVPALRERGLKFVTVSEMVEDLRAHPEDESAGSGATGP
jgi:peptidoglycan/xylan/chitin deacetylase (PgdA/CDA1 family)